MKKIGSIAAIAAAGLIAVSCGETTSKEPMKINNIMTEAEIAAGVLTPEVMWKMGRLGEIALSPDGQTLAYTLTYYNVEDNKGMSSVYVMPAQGGEAKLITDNTAGDSDIQWSKDGSKIYFLREGQIWCVTADGGKMTKISDVEGGVNGFKFSPDETNLWYVHTVKVGKVTGADNYPELTKSQVLIYDDLMERHWDYWDRGEYSHIFVAGFDGKQLTGNKDIMDGELWDAPLAPYFDNAEIAWNNAGTVVAYTCKKLRGTEYALSTDSDIYLYDLATAQTSNITKGMMGYDKYPRFSPNDEMIAFTSMERACNEADKSRLMVMNLATKELNYITKDFDYNAENVSWIDNSNLLFITPMAATLQLATANLDDQVRVITGGDHSYENFSLVNNVMIGAKSNASMATELYAVDFQTGAENQLTFINKHIYDNVTMGEVQKRMVKTTDGKEMLTWVILPPNFDQTKSYPVLLYCEGGPQSVVSHRWSYRWNWQLMANQGYIIVAPNRRGLPSFGQEWLDQISGDYSGQNIKDYLSAIDDVSKEPWADENRMGAIGASYGGYSVYYLAGHHEKRFKALIAHCGMFNFSSFYGCTEELWFPYNDLGGAYWDENPTAKRSYANSPHMFVKKWDTPLLILVGLQDFRIPYTESLQAFTAARAQGIPSRLVAFENEAHQVFKPQNNLVWNSEFFGWLNKYVKGE